MKRLAAILVALAFAGGAHAQYWRDHSSNGENITGGTIDGTTIGGTTPAAGTFTNLKSTNFTQAKTAPAIAAGVLTLNLSTANVFVVSLNANITTMTVSNCAASGTLQSWLVVMAADGSARTISWATGTKWMNPGEAAPTPSSTSGKADAYTAFSYDGCTTIYTNPVAIGYTL